jgi:hypothetical protein
MRSIMLGLFCWRNLQLPDEQVLIRALRLSFSRRANKEW